MRTRRVAKRAESARAERVHVVVADLLGEVDVPPRLLDAADDGAVGDGAIAVRRAGTTCQYARIRRGFASSMMEMTSGRTGSMTMRPVAVA